MTDRIQITERLAKLWGIDRGEVPNNPIESYECSIPVCLGAGVDIDVGEVVEMPRGRAAPLVATGNLVLVSSRMVTQDPRPTHSDPAPEHADPAPPAKRTARG